MKTRMKKQIEATEARLQAKRAAIKDAEARSEKSTDVEELKRINAEIRGLNADVDAIIADLNGLKEMYGEMDEPAGGEGGAGGEGASEGARAGNLNKITETRGVNPAGENAEKRAAKFAASGRMNITNKEARAVLVSSGKIATPTEVSGINETFNGVSSIVDKVNVTDAEGMGAYKVAFEVTDPEALETAEGVEYNESEPDYATVEITPEKVTVISYISEEVQKQTPLKYEEKVKAAALRALRRKAGEIITVKVKASGITDKVTLNSATIDEHTLRKIALSYGGDENVVGGCTLYLNKNDLLAFGDVRGDNEKQAVYEITPDTNNPNTGIIKDGGLSVKYCINSKLTALSGATKGAEPIKTMFYGVTEEAVELGLFGDYEIKVSEDFKFSQGLLAIRGSVQLGANVVKQGGVVVVELAANA